MSNARLNSLQTYTMLLYRKAFHPEFFAIEGRRSESQGGAEAEGWIFKGGHCVRFQVGDLVLCEVLTDEPSLLPERALNVQLPCAGERDHDERMGTGHHFYTTMQTETLSEHLYLGEYKELLARARAAQSLLSVWKDEQDRPNLSVVEMSRSTAGVNVEAWHLRSDCGLVLRSSSMVCIKGRAGA
ncbi:MAG: hypothetical protein O2819_02905 [Planctomycetota bacterium]|nr:hypothetical protein [Planctomycetota bacterium]MDA1105086.1 hypothetical protein [Planctomycetota bacterium]